MLNRLIHQFKIEIKAKDVAVWFVLSFIGVFAVFLGLQKRTLDASLIIETFGFASVFVLMMITTKSYGHFVDHYYQSHIDRQKHKHANAKPSKKQK